jgi:hypothetical protein
MFDPIPRSHMFMIDARRMSGSGCCVSTHRTGAEHTNRIAEDYWNRELHQRFRRISPAVLRWNYGREPEIGNLIALHDNALNEWRNYLRVNFSRQTSEELTREFERILAQYHRDVRVITNAIWARRQPVVNRNNNNDAVAQRMANMNNIEQMVEQ